MAKFTVTSDDGTDVEFESADTIASRWVCTEILRGRTYPHLPFVPEVEVVMDVGANCGAAAVYFARHYPNARIHAFEPGREQRAMLERNVASLENVEVHPIGLHSVDGVVPLYKGKGDTIMASILLRENNDPDDSEPIQLRAASGWTAEHGIERIDVLKVDVEGVEIEVLQSLAPFLPDVKVLYIEYDSRQARRDVDALMDATHELYTGVMFLDQGECIYLRRDLADLSAANEHLHYLLTEGRTADGQS